MSMQRHTELYNRLLRLRRGNGERLKSLHIGYNVHYSGDECTKISSSICFLRFIPKYLIFFCKMRFTILKIFSLSVEMIIYFFFFISILYYFDFQS